VLAAWGVFLTPLVFTLMKEKYDVKVARRARYLADRARMAEAKRIAVRVQEFP
jgi:hypothetical protein